MTSNTAPQPPSFDAPLAGRLDRAAEAEVETARQRFARAQARLALGRDDLARRDLEAASDEVGDAARLELAYLDLRQKGRLRHVLRV
ncbi:MAG: hypothetical protein ACC662_05800, partial [Planctomycetota bacterium]